MALVQIYNAISPDTHVKPAITTLKSQFMARSLVALLLAASQKAHRAQDPQRDADDNFHYMAKRIYRRDAYACAIYRPRVVTMIIDC